MNESNDFSLISNPPRIVPFSSTSTAYGRLSEFTPELLQTLNEVVGNKDSHLPEWLTQRKIELIQKNQESKYQTEIVDSTDVEYQQTISHIYMSRKTDSGIEFLIQFEGDKSPICSWINEKKIFANPSFPYQLELFQKDPFDFKLLKETDNSSIIVITHRVYKNTKIYLFNVSTMAFNVYFWENVKNEDENEAARNYEYYFKRFPISTDEIVKDIPQFNSDKLPEYQIEAVEWLLSHWKNNEPCILGDEKSLGNSRQFLEFLNFIAEYVNGPFLIITNSDQLTKWKDELTEYKKLYCMIYDGDERSCEVMREYGFYSVSDEGLPLKDSVSFNVLLISYDILFREIEFFNQIKFQMIVIDNPTLAYLDLLEFDSIYKVIIYDNFIESSTKTIIKIISFLRPDMHLNESLFTKVYKERAKQLFESIILCRTGQSIFSDEKLIEDYIGFIMPTSFQRMMLKLIDLHELYKICQPDDPHYFDFTSNEILSQKVCNHPYLIDGFEDFLQLKIGGDKRNRLIGVSSKFIVLDRILHITLNKNVKVVIFTQSNSFCELIEQLFNLSNWPYLTIKKDVDLNEKNRRIDEFNGHSNCRILLSQVQLKLYEISSAALIFILDPCWNPVNNDFSIDKKSNKLLIRLITFNTSENETYIELRKQRDLWESILITKDMPNNQTTQLICPPDFSTLSDRPACDNFVDEINKIMQIVPTNSVLENAIVESNSSDKDFIEFVESSIAIPKKAFELPKIERHDFFLLIDNLKKFGYGEFKEIQKNLNLLDETQIFQFCAVIVIYSFQSINVTQVPLFPVLISKLNITVPDFTVDCLFSSSQKSRMPLFGDISTQISKYRSEISFEAFEILEILEFRCIYKIWSLNFGKDYFVFSKLPPIHDHDRDWLLFNSFVCNTDININDRIIEIVRQMKYDLLIENAFECNQFFNWWCKGEFEEVLRVFSSYGFDVIDSNEFHAMTGLLSKNSKEVKRFALGLRSAICTGNNLYQLHPAPDYVQKIPDYFEWSKVNEEDVLRVKFAEEFMSNVNFCLMNLDKIHFDLPVKWTIRSLKKFLLLLRQFGIDSFDNILKDKCYGFHQIDESIFSDIDSFFFFLSRTKETFKNCK